MSAVSLDARIVILLKTDKEYRVLTNYHDTNLTRPSHVMPGSHVIRTK
jgi:hypothetical protein